MSPRHAFGAALFALALALGGCGGRHVVDVTMGKAGTTSGTRVMVEAWKAAIEPLPGTGQQPADGSHSGIDVVSCRTAEGGSILDAGSFRLEMDDGARLEPVGSRLRVAGAQPNCLPATIVFRTDGRKPTHVRYEGGSTTLRWAVP